MNLSDSTRNRQAAVMAELLSGAALSIADRSGAVLVTLALGPFAPDGIGGVQMVGETAAIATRGGRAAAFNVRRGEQQVLDGIPSELGAPEFIPEAARVILKNLSFRIP